MNIKEFVSGFRNHPVLFIGTGVSLRYLENSYTWDGLLKKVATNLKGTSEYYYDIKSQYEEAGIYDYSKIAGIIERDFNKKLIDDRNGPFKAINDRFYENMKKDINLSRFKIYLSELLNNSTIKQEKETEIAELKKVRKNIASIITTNYDQLIEDIFNFNPLIGNDILLSNPYGSVYKIHGCVSDPSKIIITDQDYSEFSNKYDLIRAQLLSLFIHNPIIFIGYSIGDENIKSLLRTIFSYVEPNSAQSKKIRDNFLLIEYDQGSDTKEIMEHDIDIENVSTVRINKISTDNFVSIYKELSELTLPVSAMDIQKVQNVVKEIYSGGEIKVNITEDLDQLRNSDKVIAIGSDKTIKYQHQTISEMMSNYFVILDESNKQVLNLINKQIISKSQYFPIYAFSKINESINEEQKLKEQQRNKIEEQLERVPGSCKTDNETIKEILEDEEITKSNKQYAILWSMMNDKIQMGDVEQYLKSYKDKLDTPYRKLLCAYDLKKYSD